VRESLFARNELAGIWATGIKAQVERSEVIGGLLRTSRGGIGIAVGCTKGANKTCIKGASVTVRDSLLRDHPHSAFQAVNSTLDLERTVIRDIRDTTGKFDAYGVLAVQRASEDPGEAFPHGLIVKDSRIAGCDGYGIYTKDDTVVSGTIIDDIRSNLANKNGGHGILLSVDLKLWWSMPTLRLTESLISRCHQTGVSLYVAAADLRRVVVRDTLTSKLGYGDGIMNNGGTLTLRDSLSENNARSGVMLCHGASSISRTELSGNKLALIACSDTSYKLNGDNLLVENEVDAPTKNPSLKPVPPPDLPPSMFQ
jgi:hypothetical protein